MRTITPSEFRFGFKFLSEEPSVLLQLSKEFEAEGKIHQHQAELVWMRTITPSEFRFGFKFLSEEPSVLLHQ
jgi:hypothetical protein